MSKTGDLWREVMDGLRAEGRSCASCGHRSDFIAPGMKRHTCTLQDGGGCVVPVDPSYLCSEWKDRK